MSTFNEWLDENRDRLEDLLRGDTEELLFEAWLAGYDAGGKDLAKFAAGLWRDIK